MTYNEENYVLSTLKRIRADTKENNRLLKENNSLLRENNRILRQLYKYFSNVAANANQENINDFGRNVLANIISTQLELFKRR